MIDQKTQAPVDNATYNILQTLTSKLEAIEVYKRYAKDGNADLFNRFIEQDSADVHELMDTLKGKLR